MLTSTTGLALVNWSQEDLVICSVSIPNHLTFLLTVTLSSQRSTIHRWIGAPALPPQVLSRTYRSVSCHPRPNYSDLRLAVVFDSLITTRWIWSQDRNGGGPYPRMAFHLSNLWTRGKDQRPFTHGAVFFGKPPSGRNTRVMDALWHRLQALRGGGGESWNLPADNNKWCPKGDFK